jgi:nitroreductase
MVLYLLVFCLKRVSGDKIVLKYKKQGEVKMNAILSRRSIRSYTREQIQDSVIEELLEAAMSAPSAGNQQPWHFIIIKNRQLLDQIPKVHPYAQMVKEAPVAIVVCGDKNLEKYPGFWVQDCSAATENILISVSEKGLGAVWLGVYPDPDRVNAIQALLSMPENVVPLSIIPIGYPAEEKPPARRYDQSRVHMDTW